MLKMEDEEEGCGEPRLECEMEEVGPPGRAKPYREPRKINGSIALQLKPSAQPIHHETTTANRRHPYHPTFRRNSNSNTHTPPSK
jgi:hypothetical protein